MGDSFLECECGWSGPPGNAFKLGEWPICPECDEPVRLSEAQRRAVCEAIEALDGRRDESLPSVLALIREVRHLRREV